MTEGDASTRFTYAIGFKTLATGRPSLITLELPLPAGHARSCQSCHQLRSGAEDSPASSRPSHDARVLAT